MCKIIIVNFESFVWKSPCPAKCPSNQFFEASLNFKYKKLLFTDSKMCLNLSSLILRLELIFSFQRSPWNSILSLKISFKKSLKSASKSYPDNRSFSWHAKNGEKRKTSEEIVSKSC